MVMQWAPTILLLSSLGFQHTVGLNGGQVFSVKSSFYEKLFFLLIFFILYFLKLENLSHI